MNRAWGHVNSNHMLLFELFHAAEAMLVSSAFELGAVCRIKAMTLSLQHTLWPEEKGGEKSKHSMKAASSSPPSRYISAYTSRSNGKK